MGVNLFLAIDGWESTHNAGMKEILRDDIRFPKIWKDTGPIVWGECPDMLFRPTDFNLWRKHLKCNIEMWSRGLEAMEADPDLWIEASI